MRASSFVVLTALLVTAGPALGQTAPPAPPPSGRQLFDRLCTSCHGNADTPRAADPAALRRLLPERIYDALATGNMQTHAEGLTDQALRSIAEYLGERKIGTGANADARAMPNRCSASGPAARAATRPAWNGWGVDLANTRFQPASQAGVTAENVSRLTLKWAFGVPGATAVYGQPTLSGGRVFVGADTGYVYALDRASGCVYWSFRARAGVRTAGLVGAIGSGRTALHIGDMKGWIYALDVATGAEIWTAHVDEHALTRITATPVLHQGRLYVAASSGEEGASTSARYPCCTFRGSVSAFDASTGARVWKTFTVSDVPTRTNAASESVGRFGPSGGGVWSTPTIDTVRNALYVGTGNAYSRPAGPMTDAVVAFALDTGRVLWAVQATTDDAWIPACNPQAPAPNCPTPLGPDYDFGASPILVTQPGGQRLLLSAQKSGVLWAQDPDRHGAVIWRSAPPPTPVNAEGEMVWGAAVDDRRAYAGLTSGGLTAIELATGTTAWTRRIAPIEGRRHGQSGAVSVSPGLVWSGGWDGILRAVSADTGEDRWSFDTLRDFTTVNGVAARGGSMGAAGPTIADGMVFVGSGYIGVRSGTAGNVLLAFGIE